MDRITRATLFYFQNHPDEHVSIHAAGARASVPISSVVQVYYVPTFGRSEHSDCMRAAIAKGIHSHKPDDAVRFLSLGDIPDERFGTFDNWLPSNYLLYTLQNCNVGTSIPDAWLMYQFDGIYIFILQGSDPYGD